VKALREGRCMLRDAFAKVERGELWLHGVHIGTYEFSHGLGSHAPDRTRKLLLHRRQIDELAGRAQEKALTLIPLSIYFKRGIAKVDIGLARGRREYDKRQVIAERDAARDAERAMAAARRHGVSTR